MESINNEYLEKCVVKAALTDKDFAVIITNAFLPEYFTVRDAGSIIRFLTSHLKSYNTVPSFEIIGNTVDNIAGYLQDISDCQFDLLTEYDWLMTNANNYLKEKAMKKAILDSVSIIERGQNLSEIRSVVEDALCKDIKIDLGLNYWVDLGERMRHILSSNDTRVPTFYPLVDEYTNGGFPKRGILGVIAGPTHSGKCTQYNTIITIKKNNHIEKIKIGAFFDRNSGLSYSKNNQIDFIVDLKNYIEVLSDIGWIPISKIIKTVPLKKLLILFESGKELECATDHILISPDNKEIYARNLCIGAKVKINGGSDAIFEIFELHEEESLYDLNLPYHHLFYTNDILSHNSQFCINIACRQALNGFNPVIFTFEMDKYEYSTRADGIFSGLDINRLYLNTNSITTLVRELRRVKENTVAGNLIIKDFPTGSATVNDLIIFLRELKMRGINPDIVYVDYIAIMKGRYRENSYLNIKTLAEELRAMGIMFNIPVVTFSQINREGSRLPFRDLTLGYTSESKALEDTADFYALIGIDEDQLVYENTIWWKIVKNRLGGRKEVVMFYIDFKSLKIYSEHEIDLWLGDAAKSGDTRDVAQIART